jgi:hypothetical protein
VNETPPSCLAAQREPRERGPTVSERRAAEQQAAATAASDKRKQRRKAAPRRPAASLLLSLPDEVLRHICDRMKRCTLGCTTRSCSYLKSVVYRCSFWATLSREQLAYELTDTFWHNARAAARARVVASWTAVCPLTPTANEKAEPTYPTYVNLTVPALHLLRTGRLCSLHTLVLSDCCIRDAELLGQILYTARATLQRLLLHADEYSQGDGNHIDLTCFLTNVAKAAPTRLEELNLELEEISTKATPEAVLTTQLPNIMRTCRAVRFFTLRLVDSMYSELLPLPGLGNMLSAARGKLASSGEAQSVHGYSLTHELLQRGACPSGLRALHLLGKARYQN